MPPAAHGDHVADETGVTVVDDLQLESLSDEAPTYADLLQQAGAKISQALGG